MRGTHALELDAARGIVGFMLAGRVTLLALADWRRLESLGPEARWTTADSRGRSFPAVHHPAFGKMLAARLILGAADSQEIGYRDGDAFHLVKGNLVVKEQARFRHAARRRVALPVLVGGVPV